ncbi:MAG: transposase [Nitrosomonas sp.]|nr:transposase [Nitrosomonas sp.]
MPRQSSFADFDYNHKKRRTRREVFLSKMERVMPWPVLLSHVETRYPKAGRRGRQQIALESMFRLYCMQNWFNLSDREMEDTLYEIEVCGALRDFSV